MLIREALKSPELSENEKRLGQYLLEQGIQLEKSTVRTIAKDVYMAPSSIIRFVQKIGFEGFNDFKKQFIEETRYLSTHFQEIDSNRPFTENDKNIVIASKIGLLYEETLKDTIMLVDHDQLQEAINRIVKCEFISIVASGAQVGIAHTFKDKMMKIGKKVTVFESVDDAFYEACYCDSRTLFILISYSGETSKCLSVCHKLKERKQSFITITTYGTNTLSQESDCCLYVSTRERLIDNLGTFTFNLSLLYLLDVLYAGYFNTNYQMNLKNKTKNSQECENISTIQGRKTNNPIIK